LFIAIFSFIEYFIFFSEYNYIITDFKYSFQNKNLDNYFFNKISPLKSYRKFIDNNRQYSYNFLIIILFFQLSYYGFIFSKMKNFPFIETLLVNFFDLFFF
jgi:hypothetical protein